MPTGSGKTAVLMMAPYVLDSTKVLVVTPSQMVREQIAGEFRTLRTLVRLGVLANDVVRPEVFEMSHLYSEEMLESLVQADVIIATPRCALTLTQDTSARLLFDLIVVDEAHHVPAVTWRQILQNTNHAKQIPI